MNEIFLRDEVADRKEEIKLQRFDENVGAFFIFLVCFSTKVGIFSSKSKHAIENEMRIMKTMKTKNTNL